MRRKGGTLGASSLSSPRDDAVDSPRERMGCGLRAYLGFAILCTAAASVFVLSAMSTTPTPVSSMDHLVRGSASDDPQTSLPPVPTTAASVDAAAAAAGGDGPSFPHSDDPVPAGHEEVDRPLAGRGCTFSACNREPGRWRVGGKPATSLPLVYIVVPHRNRLDNIVRLLSSLVNATTRAQRDCMCVIVTDFNTSTAAIPPWKNVHCLVSYRAEHNIWMDDEAYYRGKKLSRGELKASASTYASAPECPDVAPPEPSALARVGGSRGEWATARAAFPPAHMDVMGLTGRQALRYALSFYDGESAIVDGDAYVHNPKVKFSRAGGIMGGVDAIGTPTESSLLFVCDADVIIRPGFFEEVVDVPVQGSIVFYPILWSMCWGTTLEVRRNRGSSVH